MIQSLAIKNFLSFKDAVTFSFEATKDKHLEDYQVVQVAPGVRLTKLGIVYGANASGKSNLLNAFEFILDFFLNDTNSKDVETKTIPFLLDNHSKEQPSEFVLTFYIGDRKHIYSLILTSINVITETLTYYPGTQPFEIFTRQLNLNVSKIRFNPALRISASAKEEIEVKCLTNMSVFAAYNKVNVHSPEMDMVISWMKENYLNKIMPQTKYLEKFTENLILKNNTVKDSILKFLSEADFNIKNINIKVEEKTINDSFIKIALDNNSIPIEEKERLKKDKTIQITRAMYTHKVTDNTGREEYYDLPERLESEGTLRTMGLAGVINHVVAQNAFVAIDEIESSLHPRLVEFFIENFLRQSKESQMLLTTHYDGLLEEEDILRNDNIWFTNKKKDGSTELYCLSDFKGVNRISSLQKAYKYGKFGAVPNI